MKEKNRFAISELKDYLKACGYHLTFRNGDSDANYNPRTRKHLLIPFKEGILSKKDIVHIFRRNQQSIDLPPHLEWSRFKLYMYNPNAFIMQ